MSRLRAPTSVDIAQAGRDPRLRRALTLPVADLSWRARAVCRSADPEIFFPPPNEPMDAAIAVCRTCPVQAQCLALALHVEDRHGVWGATTPRERRAMLVIWRSVRGAQSPVYRNSPPTSLRYYRRK